MLLFEEVWSLCIEAYYVIYLNIHLRWHGWFMGTKRTSGHTKYTIYYLFD